MGTSSIDMVDIILIIVISAGVLSWLSVVLFGNNKQSRRERPHYGRGMVRPRAGDHYSGRQHRESSHRQRTNEQPPPPEPTPPKPHERMPLTWRDVDDVVLRELRQKVVSLPTLPTLTTSLVAMLQDPDTEPKEIAKIASTDPAVATEILRAVNSAYFALRQPCNDLDRAILLLGYNWVKFLVIRLGMHRSNVTDAEHTKRLGALWYHSFMTSECVTLLLRYYSQATTAEASTAALLHDLGRLVRMDFLGEKGAIDPGLVFDTAGVPPEQRVFVEEDLFGVNHCVVGTLMGDHLNLPPLVKMVQAYHHHPLNAIWNLPQERNVIQVIAVVKLADMIAHAFNEELHPRPRVMTGALRIDPDLNDFRPFFPNLPPFPMVMATLDTELRKSHHFLEAFLPRAPKETVPHVGHGGEITREAPSRQVATEPPNEGHHKVGAMYYNGEPGPGRYVGWVCVEEGEPGLWRGFGKAPTDDEDESDEHAGLFSSDPVEKPATIVTPPPPPTSPPPLPEESSVSSLEEVEVVVPPPPVESADPIRILFDEYIRQKNANEEDTSRLSFERFKSSIENTRSSHGENLRFRVTVRNGKVTLIAKKEKKPSPSPAP